MSRAGRTQNSTETSAFQKGDNHLLVIGINQYKDSAIPNLRNARKDAEAVAQLLQESYGFDTQYCTVLYDQKADCESITDMLENFSNQVKEEDNLLIYFAGHGSYNKATRIGYLLPADAKLGKPHSYLSHSNLLEYMRAINSRHTFLILDSCFSGALFRSVGDTHRAAANLERLPSRWGLAAGLIEEVSDGFYDDNSPFAKSLLAFLKTANDTFLASDLIQHVKNAVPNNATQQPHGGILVKVGDQQGEMVFRRTTSEALDWKRIADSDNINDFLTYLRKHSYHSPHAEDAQARIKMLEDRQVWDKVNKHSISAVIQFIREHKDNTFVVEAELLLAQLEKGYTTANTKPETPILPPENNFNLPKSAEDYYKEANEKREKGDYHNAIADYNKAIQLNPQYADAYINQGIAKYDLQDYTGAIADYTKAIAINPQYAIAYNNRGNAKQNGLQDYTGAIADYTKAIELNPQDADAYNNRGIAKQNGLQDYTGAIADYTKAIAINPQYAIAYSNRGNAKQNGLQDYTGAIADYTKAIELNPQYADAYNNRGIAKKNGLQDYTGAIADYTKAIELNPQDAIAYNNRGNAKQNGLKDYTGAIADYTKAIEINPQDGLAYNNRGVAYQALGKGDLACWDFRKAIELGENNHAPDNFKKHCQGK